MVDTNVNLVDPICCPNPNFGFAFNDSNFSDRILRIEIVEDHPGTLPESSQALPHSPVRNSKRSRTDDTSESRTDVAIKTFPEEQQPDSRDGIRDGNHDEEEIPNTESSPSGDDEADSGKLNWSKDSSRVLRVKTLHVSSPILAAKSPFFYKLFSNGMMESEQRHATLTINNSEEAAFMELVNFMYSNTLTNDSTHALLDVLKIADKFEVASCMAHCSRSLSNIPMTTEFALLYLSLPSSLLMANAVKHFTDATKEFLALHYKDISKYHNEIMNLPLVGIETILSSDHLEATSEDEVYFLALKWITIHYQKLKERKEILVTLVPYIRFPYMSCQLLRNEVSRNVFRGYVNDALFFKMDALYHQRIHVKKHSTSTSRCFKERAYKIRPVKIVEFDHPKQQTVVYFELKHEECAKLLPSGRVSFQDFYLGERNLYIYANCNMNQHNPIHGFGLYLSMPGDGSSTCDVEFKISARSKPTEDYVSISKLNHALTEGKYVGFRNLFSMPWSSFMAEDCVYFINGVLHLRAELTVKR